MGGVCLRLAESVKQTENGAMKLDVYVNYRGMCEEAFRFYERHLGGVITSLVHHGDMPSQHISEDWHRKILHARITIGGTTLMGADIAHAEPMRSAYLTLSLNTIAETERIYELLSDGGEVFMRLEQTHFAARFAMLRDRFGTSWMLLHEAEP